MCRSPKHSTPTVTISMCSDRNYWLVNIECKDRSKLLFDTVCTLADLNYDVFHATIDSINGRAIQEYYVRSRLGCTGDQPPCHDAGLQKPWQHKPTCISAVSNKCMLR